MSIAVPIVVIGACLLAAPNVLQSYHVTLMLPALSYGIALLGMNLLVGYAGLLTFGHALFVALGAYTAAYMTSFYRIMNFELILVASAAVALGFAVPIGLLCVRYIRIFFGILTLAFSMLFYSFLFKFYHLTGGDEGIQVLRPVLLGIDMSRWDAVSYLTGPYYYYLFALLAASTLTMHRVVNSPFGLRLRAVRDNPEKAACLGIEVRRYRLVAFLISAVFGAIGGAAMSVTTGLADPGTAYWLHSGNMVFMLLLGGYTNFFGPVIGGFAFIFLQDQVMSITQYWRFFFGIMLAVIVIFVPHGVMGLIDRSRRWST